ncbi:DNA-directed DNA polymerase II small subunit [Methanobrevibacter sp.]|uniref:DNA-directed DNA polymerase II small subunit n=1 Tax=Methanobrevibacter sp. TaxID=66852 RepID=UPI0025F9394B|nr:DNA-directed DNA polymerase II small subunit [Methanobrevibacter sp.]MBQ2961618.1 DNA-directed DNA polymerase II small subunit [Methanobrevibacter sp.]
MTAEILIKFARKGIILSPEAYDLIKNSKNPINLSSEIIVKLKSGNYSKEMVPVDVETLKRMEGIDLGISPKVEESPKPQTKATETMASKSEEKAIEPNKPEIEEKEIELDKPKTEENDIDLNKPKIEEKPKETPKPNTAYLSEDVVRIKEAEVSKDVEIKYKRNLTESKVKFDKFKVLKDTSNKSYTSGEIGNLIEYFQNRYKKLSGILSKRPELRAWQKINEITDDQTDLNLIVMITDIRTTKNGHYLIEVEDDTGSMPILVSKDNEELYRAANNLMRDEVIGVIAQKRAGQGENRLAICQNIIDPGVPRKDRKEVDFGTVFTSDIHIGSSTFLEDAFVRFIRWLNGDFGNEEQREMANNVKYMIVGGDIVDGIGIYPNQDKELAIKDITLQYDEAARLLGDVRSDIKIIITPGNHDASRVAEPQPAVPEKYAKSLYKLNNVEFLSNPSMVSLDGLEVLIYHGRGIDDMVMGSNDFSHERNDLVMREFLNKRHLAPLYGDKTPLASELEDHLVIDKVPDVLHTGHVHINTYTNYNGIHCINSGTFQTQTEFQKIYNIVPTPAIVPIIDVGGVYKPLDFNK